MNKKVVREVNALPDSCRTPLLRKARQAGCTGTRERGGARELPGSKYDLCTSIWRGSLLVKLSSCKLVGLSGMLQHFDGRGGAGDSCDRIRANQSHSMVHFHHMSPARSGTVVC
jgi:hypothetical protein